MEFVDGIQKNKEHPESFLIPSDKEKDKMEAGFHIKVSHNKERFWSEVILIDGDKINARIDNDLVLEQPFKCDDIILVERRHILDLQDFR